MGTCSKVRSCVLLALCFAAVVAADSAVGAGNELSLTLLRRVDGPGGGTVPSREEVAWAPGNTAAIICDMWNKHGCRQAARRTAELAPRINRVAEELRERGVFIIHAPSGTMEHYSQHPARKRARRAPRAEQLPESMKSSAEPLPHEGNAELPVENGCLHQVRSTPWTHQHSAIRIEDGDAISDSGVEIWNLLAQRGIENVLFMGVHTNMCVMNRPFGLRNLVRNGKNAVLVRDCTDAYYSRRQAPHVSHFRGTDLVVDYIEKHVCPTALSSDIIDMEPFRFPRDDRPTVLLVIAEREYRTWETLPEWAHGVLGNQYNFRITEVYGWPEQNRNHIPGIAENLSRADLVVLSVRRRALPEEDMKALRSYLAAGKPLVGVRTSSHAFNLHPDWVEGEKECPPGHAEWPDFDGEVLGCNYHGHYGSGKQTAVRTAEGAADHPILAGMPESWSTPEPLYKSRPLVGDAHLLLTGKVEGEPAEPVAFTHRYGKARVFYTSLGGPADFQGAAPPVRRMLTNAAFWALSDAQ